MAFKKNSEIKFEIEEFIAPLKESDKHDWCKGLVKISWNEKPATWDIRNLNLAQNRVGSGICLTSEEVDRLTDILLDNDFGTVEKIEEALKKKKSRFTVSLDADKCFDDEEGNDYTIEIKI